MRKALWLFVGMISAVLFSTTVFAAPWNAPKNVRIVQKSNTDNVRVFSTIQAALNSITNASATNRYLIKVMPGKYDESVTMKQYVNLSGSGQGNTILTSTSAANFTIQLVEDTMIENVTVTNEGSSGGSDHGTTGVVYLNGVSATLRNVTIRMAGTQSGLLAIEAGDVFFLNSTVLRDEMTSPSAEKGIFFRGRSLVVDGSIFDMKSGNAASVEGIYGNGANGGEITIRNSALTVTQTDNVTSNAIRTPDNVRIYNSKITTSSIGNQTFENEVVIQLFGMGDVEIANSTVEDSSLIPKDGINAKNIKISNSKIVAKKTAVAGGSIHIESSSIIGDAAGISKVDGGLIKVGNSQIAGGHNGEQGVDKIVNCFDGDFDPIPNQ